MIGNKLEQAIIGILQDNLSCSLSINELAKRLKKAYPYINKKANYFFDEGILKKIPVGKSFLCFLNLNREKARILLSIRAINMREEFLKKNTNQKK